MLKGDGPVVYFGNYFWHVKKFLNFWVLANVSCLQLSFSTLVLIVNLVLFSFIIKKIRKMLSKVGSNCLYTLSIHQIWIQVLVKYLITAVKAIMYILESDVLIICSVDNESTNKIFFLTLGHYLEIELESMKKNKYTLSFLVIGRFVSTSFKKEWTIWLIFFLKSLKLLIVRLNIYQTILRTMDYE